MNPSFRATLWSIGLASGALTGCVGYDGGTDAASDRAQALGITGAEETRIRDALSQQALTAEQIERSQDALRRLDWVKDGDTPEFRNMQSIGRKRYSQRDGEGCLGDINCASLHCSQAGKCVPASAFKANGIACVDHYECGSNFCSDGSCTAPGWRKDGRISSRDGETAIDCGGDRRDGSPYACALGDTCKVDSDCVTGACVEGGLFSGYKKTCDLVRGSTHDLGAAWPGGILSIGFTHFDFPTVVRLRRGCESSAPEDTSSTCAPSNRERSRRAQYMFVSDTSRKSKDNSGALVSAATTPRFQHDTCISHLLANGCSTIAVETRVHRSTYDYVICPNSSREAVGIAARENTGFVANSADRYGTEASRSNAPLTDDPYLCNQRFTHAVRFRSRSAVFLQQVSGTSDRRLQGDAEGFASSSGAPGLVDLPVSSTANNDRNAFIAQLERLLLLNAACTQKRLQVVDNDFNMSYGIGGYLPSWGLTVLGDLWEYFEGGPINEFLPTNVVSSANWETCSRVAPWMRTAFKDIPVEFAQDEAALLAPLLSAWNNAFDIYSIDPEGNPYMPSNMNMQYAYDIDHPQSDFGAYAKSFGLKLTKTSQTYRVGDKTLKVWGTNSNTPFQWTP